MKNVIKAILVFSYLYTGCLYAQHTSPIDSLQALIKKSNNGQKIDHFIALAEIYEKVQNRNLDSAQYYAEQAIKYSEHYKKPTKKIDALYHLGWIKISAKKYDEAELHMQQVLSESEEISYNIGIRKGNFGIGRVFTYKNETYKGVSYHERAYELVKENGEARSVIVEMAVMLSAQYEYLEQYDKALELLGSVVIFLDDPSITTDTKCRFYMNAGLINFDFDQFDKALEQFIKVLEYAKKDNNTLYQLIAAANIGNLYTTAPGKRDYNKALAHNLFALDLVNKDQSMSIYKGAIFNYVALNYSYLKMYDEAMLYHEKAIEILQNGDLARYGEALLNKGYTHLEMGQTAHANTNFDEASRHFLKFIGTQKSKKENSAKEKISKSYKTLSVIDSLLGDFQKGFEHFKLYAVYKDSLAAETNLKITERLEFAKQNAEKNAEISQLALENNKQRNQREILIIGLVFIGILLIVLFNRFRLKQKGFNLIQEKNEENTLLMGEIHHRVKNNLQIILSLIGTQIDNHKANKELKAVLIESKNKIQSMAIIHQNLYRGSNFTKVHANSYIQELIQNLQKSFSGTLKFNMNIDQKEIKMGLAIPLGLILNELLTNCYKYAFPGHQNDNNTVNISFKQMDDSRKFQLLVQDNGIGLPEDFDLELSSSFGMQLVQGLVEQLNGKMEILSELGTVFKIYLEEPMAA
ncbi:histidine kinase dimerization/phosphoacceptor domain -containing protein [Spongiimicrobium salis]|uniref:histidine kinase dimerization/phosphoacceptor domain -containing protein n=1 Tax=Spongiimicrobium salis TaxID=1667022 RepID=UPI00374C9126